MTAEAIAIADRLVSAGFERKVAEEVASVLSAAKGDTAQARADADAKIAEAKADYNAKIADARAEAREDNAKLEGEFNTAVERLRGDMNEKFAGLEAHVKTMTTAVMVVGGAICAGILLLVLDKFVG